MNFINFNVLLFLIILFSSSCHSTKEGELFPKHLFRQKRQLNENAIEIKCSLFYDTFADREESIRRGYFLSKLTIKGTTIRLSDIPMENNNNTCEGRTIVIELFATEKIIFDIDYNSHGDDVTLVAAAPTFIVIGNNRKIILNGKKGKTPNQRWKRIKSSPNGVNGKAGGPGGPGGYFYGVAKNFYFQSSENETILNANKTQFPLCSDELNDYLLYTLCDDDNFQIKFYVNGGNGGRGQMGGDGERGSDGTAFNLNETLIESNGYVQGFSTILQKIVQPPEDELHLGNGVSEIILGDRATLGGRGGNAGPGGDGGKEGGIILVSLATTVCYLINNDPLTLHRGKRGKFGRDGQPGLRGLSGNLGYDIKLSIYSPKNGTIELRDVQFYRHESPYVGRILKKSIVSKRWEITFQQPRMYVYATAMFNYREFLKENFADTPTGTLQKDIFSRIDGCHVSTCVGC